MTQFTTLKLTEGVDTQIRAVGSSFVYHATTLDVQAGGIMFDYTDGGVPPETRRVFLPWSNVASIRSDEHTSELQSLMRISYAVFCLKKKKITNATNTCRILINKQ